jgi:type II secretory pathway pseudopilin PulG
MMAPCRSSRTQSGGFSLPEVTLALGLLAGVLISIAGLFVMAEQLVRGGKHQTKALAVARDILEETSGWHYSGLYETFGSDGSSASEVVDSRTNAYAAKWQQMLDQDLHETHAEIVLESVDDGGSPPVLNAARCIRISVTVFWRDQLRDREVSVATVRM